jgi:hypothetical protein
MRLRSLILILVALTLALFVVGCEETNNTGDERPIFAPTSVSVPAYSGNPSDTCSYKAYLFANNVNAFLALANAYANPALITLVNGAWTRSITADGVTMTITATRQGDGSYRWLVKLNGTDSDDGTVYANWTAMEATSTADGKSGSVTIYDDSNLPASTVDASFTWSTGANNMVTYDLQIPVENVRFVLLSNGTTGEVTEYTRASDASPWVTTGYHATWTSNGGVPTC